MREPRDPQWMQPPSPAEMLRRQQKEYQEFAAAEEAARLAREAEARKSPEQRADESRARAEASARAKEAQGAAQDAKQLKQDLLARLNASGNPGMEAREVPGKYHLSKKQKLFGKVGTNLNVKVEPAWPIGEMRWERSAKYGSDEYPYLRTGLTASGQLVPMDHGIKQDNLGPLYTKVRRASAGEGSIADPNIEPMILKALEKAARDAGLWPLF